jgi:alkylation response protein AidB-like acyl-CoA dehydrogenase
LQVVVADYRAEEGRMLKEHQLAIRETVRQFAQKELAPTATKRDRDAGFPNAEFRRMGELGLVGMLESKDNGGAAADTVCYALATIEIADDDGAASACSWSKYYCHAPATPPKSPEKGVRSRWCYITSYKAETARSIF